LTFKTVAIVPPFRVGFGLSALAAVGWLWSVGHFSDDFSYLYHQSTRSSFWGALVPSDSFISLLLEQYTHTVFLYFADLDSSWLPTVVKTAWVVAALYMCARFFSLFMPVSLAHIASTLFVFFPSHEATVYWYLSQYLMLTVALYFYAYYLLSRGAERRAVVCALAASFISYGSPAPALATTWLAWRTRGRRQALLLLVPNLIYAGYYVVTSRLMGLGIQRLNDGDPLTLVRQFALQGLTFVEATLGPSMWLKLIYGLDELTVVTALLTLAGVLLFWRTQEVDADRRRFAPDTNLIIALGLMTLVAFAMFSLTGYYPNIAFNLGNRTNIFGTALLTYLLVWAWARWRMVAVVVVLCCFATTGLSNHWRRWSAIQDAAVVTLRQTLDRHPDIETLFISGMQYSRLGQIDHIELFSEDWVVTSITELATEGRVRARSLNRNHVLGDDGMLVDVRHGDRHPLPPVLHVYDFYADELRTLTHAELPDYLETLPRFRRHWLQTVDSPLLRGWVLTLMPRLAYVFDS